LEDFRTFFYFFCSQPQPVQMFFFKCSSKDSEPLVNSRPPPLNPNHGFNPSASVLVRSSPKLDIFEASRQGLLGKVEICANEGEDIDQLSLVLVPPSYPLLRSSL
jgi:ankyrin repeat protein